MKKNILTFALLLLTVTGCSSEQSETQDKTDVAHTPEKGGVYISASIGEASNLIPWTAGDSASSEISAYIYDGMLKYDKDLNLTGSLAENWEISEDGLSITFHLRKNVTWSNGTAFTAHDVMATFKTITDPNTLTPYAGDYLMVQNAEVVDDFTFKVTYAEPFSPALASWTLKILPKERLEAEDINTSSLRENPLGTGPYMLNSWRRGQSITLKANPNHFEKEPYLSHIMVRQIPDVDTQFLELKAGRIDTMGLKPLQYTRLTNGRDFTSKFEKYHYLSNGYVYMGYNLKNPLFSDKKVRQALSYAVNRDELVNGVLFGQGLPLACPFKPGTWAYNEDITPHLQDLEKARALLAEAGWSEKDRDGILIKDGRRFEFTVVTNQGNDMRKMTAELMQQAFAGLGIKMNINVQEWSTFINNTINKRNFEAFILGWSLTPEPDPYDIFHSSKTGEKEFNIVGFNNPEADELMVKARSTFNQEERKEYLDRFQEIVHEEQPYMFLYAPYALVAINKNIQGVEPAPAGLGHNFIHWYIPKSLQTRRTFSE